MVANILYSMVANIPLITHLYETEYRTYTLIQEISWILLNHEQAYILKGIYLLKDGKITSEKGS